MLSSALTILSTQAGSFVYHLIVLLVLDAGLVIAVGQWRRGKDAFPFVVTNQARTQAVALIGMLGLRGLLVIAALIAKGSPATAVIWVPPLERAIDVISLGLLVWAFVPVLRDRTTLGLGLVAMNTVAAGVVYIILTAVWNGQVVRGNVPLDYNGAAQAWVWVIWQIGLTLAAMAVLTRDLGEKLSRGPEHNLSLFAFGGLLLGYLLHLLTLSSLLPPYPVPNVPTWMRLGQLIAYPLFVLAIYQRTISTLSSRSEELQGLSKTSMEQIKGLVNLFEASRRISQSLDISQVLEGSAQSVAQALMRINVLSHCSRMDRPVSSVWSPSTIRPARGEARRLPFPLTNSKPSSTRYAVSARYKSTSVMTMRSCDSYSR